MTAATPAKTIDELHRMYHDSPMLSGNELWIKQDYVLAAVKELRDYIKQTKNMDKIKGSCGNYHWLWSPECCALINDFEREIDSLFGKEEAKRK